MRFDWKACLIGALVVLCTLSLMGANNSISNGFGLLRTEKNIDTVTGALVHSPVVLVASVHRNELHKGEMFGICGTTTLQNTDTLDIVFNSPEADEEVAHVLYSVTGTANGLVELFQTTQLTNGTTIPSSNFDWTNLVTTTDVVIQFPGQVDDEGTRKVVGLFGSGKKFGGSLVSDDERLVGDGLTALMRITSNANSNQIVYCWSWHQKDDLP